MKQYGLKQIYHIITLVWAYSCQG